MRSGQNINRWLVMSIASVVPALWAFAATPQEQLDQASTLFQQGQYEQAKQALLELNRDQLNDAQKERRDQLVEQATTAVNQSAKARQDLDDAQRAFDAKDRESARKLYQAVQKNSYATQAQRRKATEGLASIDKQVALERQLGATASRPARSGETATRPAAGGSSTRPADGLSKARAERNRAEANGLIQSGDEAASKGQYDLAEQKYQEALKLVPSHPAALDGLNNIRQQRQVEGKSNLLEESTARRQMVWEQTELEYHQNENEIRKLINDSKFDEAHQKLEMTRRLLDSGRGSAQPAERYMVLSRNLDGLARFVDNQQQEYNEAQTTDQRRAAIEKERERMQADQKDRDERIGQLFSQVAQLQKEQQYKKAMEVVKEVLAIDPTFERAQTKLEDLHTMQILKEQKVNEKVFDSEFMDVTIESEKALTPLVTGKENKFVRYPEEEEWRMISKRDPFGAGLSGETEGDRVARQKLAATIPTLEFAQGTRFEDAIEFFRTKGGISIDVNWRTLSDQNVDQNTEVAAMTLKDVKLEAALDLLLGNVGGAEVEMGYDVIDGVVRVSTREDLNRKTITRAYDVQDLLVRVKSFSAPSSSRGGMMGGFGGMGGMMGGMGGMMGGMGGMMGGMGGMGGYGGMGGMGGYGGMGGMGGYGGGGYGGGGYGGGGYGGGGYGGGYGGGGYGEGDDDDDSSETARQDLITELEDLIKNLIEPGTWSPDGDIGSLQVWNDRMIVRHTASAHRELTDLLRQLREAKDIQVVVEARFISMTSNFLEEIGVDLDVVLNSGNAGLDRAIGANGPLRDPNTGSILLQPRQFTQLGFTPTGGGFGTPLGSTAALQQPYGNVALVPQGSPQNWLDRHTTPIPLINHTSDLATPRATGVPGSLGGGAIDPAFQVFGSFLDNIQVDFLMRATQMDVRSSSVDAPRLTIYNGRSSYIEVNTQVAYVATPGFAPVGGAVQGGEGSFGQVPQISFLPRGRTLEVTPTVSADRKYVTLQVEPVVTNVRMFQIPVQQGALASFFQVPEFDITTIRTTVSVPDGGTILLGGLKLAGETEVDAGVPILSKIPVLKRAYNNRSRVKDEFVLLVLIKPSIVIQQEQENNAFPDLFTSDSAGKR